MFGATQLNLLLLEGVLKKQSIAKSLFSPTPKGDTFSEVRRTGLSNWADSTIAKSCSKKIVENMAWRGTMNRELSLRSFCVKHTSMGRIA